MVELPEDEWTPEERAHAARHNAALDAFRATAEAVLVERGLAAATLDDWQAAREKIARSMADLLVVDAAVAGDIGFHMVDWAADARFVVALLAVPERFSKDEVAAGVQVFLVHAPNHIAAAAQLAGSSVRDIFGVGVGGSGDAEGVGDV